MLKKHNANRMKIGDIEGEKPKGVVDERLVEKRERESQRMMTRFTCNDKGKRLLS